MKTKTIIRIVLIFASTIDSVNLIWHMSLEKPCHQRRNLPGLAMEDTARDRATAIGRGQELHGLPAPTRKSAALRVTY